ncbi:MAG: 2-isopropylmalate synthase [Deltaproteobacteria bacterium RIFCSPLOWO2_12_FULL_40_28]|nr:MAG: 2-isopropylmalate synthase [Deltaproteobacteria bacterium RIFCSPHIGHO2_02_FULL_40_28]OGQ18952.1 MAG: 2-isopropylmalate synthase [Deltaproteobacteria bacterium RIFCSPHIGHO2_12_FULL_40_32]OGQ39495.1 MAG: 2-isopropylmalate synthase [Deltaproteobacteria bacterium RIFCSPLOWO2_02_FULL_40_36]OGQ53385.1 MAG: 2-isopropylmalate synthase [Deltaproteobacteria bacterium RIFCSPLOWO2_12_FULL_40_28]
MNHVIKIFDTTLRDGEQSPGCSMNLDEKLRMAIELSKLNVDIIEAGFPVASQGDFEAVKTIAKEVKGPVVAGLSRANKMDIDRCWEAVKNAARPRIHTFIATSDIHLKYKLNKTREQVLEEAAFAVAHAKHYTPDVEFSAEDATRSDRAYLAKVFETVIASGATTINVPDTVGYTIPSEFGALIRYLKENVPNINQAVISVHCHNDLGLAVANSLVAVENGARQVECTVNGIGERAGNASLEEIVMTLNVRKDKIPYTTSIRTEQIYPASKLLTHITGMHVQPNKAIVGDNAFAHEAGIHQDGILKYQQTYEIMTPESVGIPRNKLILGKHSGRHAFRERLNVLGVPLDDVELDRAFKAFKDLADRKKNVYDEDILSLVETQEEKTRDKYIFKSSKVVSESTKLASASVVVEKNGQEMFATEMGAGPVDAVYKAIKNLTHFEGTLERYGVNAITGGTDAQGEVFVTISDNKKTTRGSGAHTDIIVASAMAFLQAINRMGEATSRKSPQGI